MKIIPVAAKIWMNAVFLMGISLGLITLIEGDFLGMFLAALAFFFGFTVTIPLLSLVFLLINVTKRLFQYSIPARIAWLTFYLIMLFYFYYLAVLKMIGVAAFETFFNHLVFLTSALVPVAVFICRKSLFEFYECAK